VREAHQTIQAAYEKRKTSPIFPSKESNIFISLPTRSQPGGQSSCLTDPPLYIELLCRFAHHLTSLRHKSFHVPKAQKKLATMKNTKLVAILVLQAILVMGILSHVNGTPPS
jgi:hypothetical protein